MKKIIFICVFTMCSIFSFSKSHKLITTDFENIYYGNEMQTIEYTVSDHTYNFVGDREMCKNTIMFVSYNAFFKSFTYNIEGSPNTIENAYVISINNNNETAYIVGVRIPNGDNNIFIPIMGYIIKNNKPKTDCLVLCSINITDLDF